MYIYIHTHIWSEGVSTIDDAFISLNLESSFTQKNVNRTVYIYIYNTVRMRGTL